MVTAPGHAALLSYLNEIKPGSILHGRYLIEEPLGSGGMGSVYAARHVKLGTRLAIKVLLPELLNDADSIGRFGREARAAAKITDENVVRILDVGQLESGAPYMVMEFLEGKDGAHYLKEHGRLSIEHAIDVMLQSCAALTAAHAMNIIHRDIKPSNLFFVPRPAGRPLVKMLDFGVSKIVSKGNQEPSSQVTKAGSILGSPGYVPPEQWFITNNADKRSDIWALGVLFYEFLTGRVPFEAPSLPILATKIAYESPTPPRQMRDEIPVDVETIVMRCLEKSPENRFQDVTSMAVALRLCQQSHQGLNGSADNQPMRAGIAAGDRRLGRLPFSIRTAAAALAALLLIIGIGSFFHQRDPVTAQRPGSVASRPAPQTPVRVVPVAPVGAVSPTPPGGSSLAIEQPSLAAPVARPKATPPQQHSRATGGPARLANQGRRHPGAKADPNDPRCQPPYYINAQGSRLFKVECL